MANKTILDFPEVTDVQDNDILYLIRGTGTTRDKKVKARTIQRQVVSLDITGTIDYLIMMAMY